MRELQESTERYAALAADPRASADEIVAAEKGVVEAATRFASVAARAVAIDPTDEMTARRERRADVFVSAIAPSTPPQGVIGIRAAYVAGWEAARREIFTRIARGVARRRADALVATAKNGRGGTDEDRGHR